MSRRYAISLAAAVVVLIAIVLAVAFCRPKPRAEIEVTPATFAAAIKNYACGDTLKLAGGTPYSAPRWSTKDCPGGDGVTIVSADPANRAVFVGGVLMDNARSVIFRDVDIEQTATTASSGHVWRAYAGRDVTFRRVHFKGTVAPDGGKWAYGITTQNLTGLTVEECQFRDVYMGLSVGTITNLRIVDNDITDFGSDGINLGGIVNGLVSGNYISRATPAAGAHPDGIQIQQPGSTRASQNLTVSGNLVDVPFAGPTFQGIFGGAENKLTMSNIVFERNVVLNGPYNALSFNYADPLAMTDNLILFEQHPDPSWKAWIRIDQSAGKLTGNTANSYVVANSPNLQQSGNVTKGFATTAEIDAARAAWMQEHRGTGPAPPNCQQCEAEKAALEEQVTTLQGQVSTLTAANDNLKAANDNLQKRIDDAVAILTAPAARAR